MITHTGYPMAEHFIFKQVKREAEKNEEDYKLQILVS